MTGGKQQRGSLVIYPPNIHIQVVRYFGPGRPDEIN
jgi:hypothetical protein